MLLWTKKREPYSIMYKSEQQLFDNRWGPSVVSRGDGTLSQIKNIALTVECHLSNHVHVTRHPEWKSWWTFVFIHIPLINLQDMMSSKDFYKRHRWPLASSVLLTEKRNWISGERAALASSITDAASFQVPESIWTIWTLPTSPNSCNTSFCMCFSISSPVAMVILYGSTRLWKAVRLQIWMDVFRTAHCTGNANL